jgi:hypothetical protein
VDPFFDPRLSHTPHAAIRNASNLYTTCWAIVQPALFLVANVLAKVARKFLIFCLLSTRAQVDFIMHENTPHFVDAFIYRFLFKTYQIRAKLVDLTRPGEGPSGLDILSKV